LVGDVELDRADVARALARRSGGLAVVASMWRMLAKTVWPASASVRAVMAPKPLEAPVMRIVLDMESAPS
jgi:hypothetical protein